MKTNKDTLKTAMDRRLSFLDDVPSCRPALEYRIAQEEEPVMKKKVSLGFVFAMVMVLLSVAALATGLLLSPRADAARSADQALEKAYGITPEMMTFFAREEEELPEGGVKVTYNGIGSMDYVLGTYTVLVRGGKTAVSWSHEGEDVSGGYAAEAWGAEQLKQMIADSKQPDSKQAYMDRAGAIAEKHNAVREDEESSEEIEGLHEQIRANKTAALKARKISEEEMIQTAREFIISNYGLNKEQTERLDLYTNSFKNSDDEWYDTVNGKPCFQVEYLLYAPCTTEMMDNGEDPERMEMDGFYNVYVNVETGEIEEYQYNSALAGLG